MTLAWLVALAIQNADVDRILKAYEAAKPAEKDLQIYKLDWAPSLDEAKARAAKDPRPILLVCGEQLEDAGSFYTGHC